MRLSVAELLALRFQFEELTKNYTMPEHESHIDIIRWFAEEGYKSNSLRNGFKEATKIAKKIKEYADGCTKTTRTRKQIRKS